MTARDAVDHKLAFILRQNKRPTLDKVNDAMLKSNALLPGRRTQTNIRLNKLKKMLTPGEFNHYTDFEGRNFTSTVGGELGRPPAAGRGVYRRYRRRNKRRRKMSIAERNTLRKQQQQKRRKNAAAGKKQRQLKRKKKR